MGIIKVFKTSKEYKEYSEFEEKGKLNEIEYAKQHPSEKIHFIFHGSCVSCVTPLHYGIGNCTGCKFYHGVTSKFPELKIKNFIK
jgi:hypothetical protein